MTLDSTQRDSSRKDSQAASAVVNRPLRSLRIGRFYDLGSMSVMAWFHQPSSQVLTDPRTRTSGMEKPPREAASHPALALLRADPEFLIAGQRAAGRGHSHKTGSSSARNRGREEGVANYGEDCGNSVEGDAGCSRKTLPENATSLPNLTPVGLQLDKRAQTYR